MKKDGYKTNGIKLKAMQYSSNKRIGKYKEKKQNTILRYIEPITIEKNTFYVYKELSNEISNRKT